MGFLFEAEFGVEAGVVVVFNTVFERGNVCDVALFLNEAGFFSGRVDGAGLPIIAHPSGVFVASWYLSSLCVCCIWSRAEMQSLPSKRIVGQSCFLGNFEER